MRVLVLGGSEFVGRHFVLSARAAGLDVTLLNRGRTNPELFADLQRMRGDRDDPAVLAVAAEQPWDAVVDTCGYLPASVRRSVEALRPVADRYLFVSTVSVYDLDGLEPGADESATRQRADYDSSDVTPQTYGPLKVACEDVVTEVWDDASVIVRPGLVAGPFDPTDRFTFWMARALAPEPFVVPATDSPLQVIDARDLADFVVRLLLSAASGAYQAVGDPGTTLAATVRRAAELAGRGATPVPVAVSDLEQAGVRPWHDLPLWVASDGPPFLQLDPSRALAAGLTHRSMDDTILATQTWYAARPDQTLTTGWSREQEAALL